MASESRHSAPRRPAGGTAGTAPLPPGEVLEPSFFDRSSDVVAADLIGKVLWAPGVGGGRLTEVEAYLPSEDPASHAACGLTRRNAAMFGPPGTVYVFLSYGVHFLVNLVCDRAGIGSAVLIRAVEVVDNGATSEAQEAARLQPKSYCGPGRVGAFFGVHLGLNGLALGDESGLFMMDDGSRPEVCVTTRIGITRGAALPLRYHANDSDCVTRRSARR